MKLNLCKIFNVEEEEEFKIDRGVNYPRNNTYFIKDNTLLYKNEQCGIVIEESNLGINTLKQIKEIIKLPKRKEFTEDELNILKNIDKEYKWIARDKCGALYVYENKKPYKETDHWMSGGSYINYPYKHIFSSISWKDNEPVKIDDYVNRD